jgi:type IV pilus assembly protein PilO
MPDLRQTRKNIKTSLTILLGVDVVALVVLFLVGSTESRRQELNQLSVELQTKTRQVEPLTNMPDKVRTANRQIEDFYKKRFPAQDSQIATEFGKLTAANGVTIERVRYPVNMKDEETGQLRAVDIEAELSGNYASLARFINALERDDMFFLVSSITLAGEQKGPIKLQMKLETYLKAGA